MGSLVEQDPSFGTCDLIPVQAGHLFHDFLFEDTFLIKKTNKHVSLNVSDAVEYYTSMKIDPYEDLWYILGLKSSSSYYLCGLEKDPSLGFLIWKVDINNSTVINCVKPR